MSESLFVFFVAAALLLAYAAIDRPDAAALRRARRRARASPRSRAPRPIVLAAFLVIPLAWRLRDVDRPAPDRARRRSCSPWPRSSSRRGRSATPRTFHDVRAGLEQPGADRRRRELPAHVLRPVPRLVALDVRQRRRARRRVLRGVQRQPARLRRGRRPRTSPGATGSTTSATTSATCRRSAVARLLRTFGLFRPAQQTQLEALEGRPLGWERAGTYMYWRARAARDRRASWCWSAAGPTVWPLVAALADRRRVDGPHLRHPAVPHHRGAGDPRARRGRDRRARARTCGGRSAVGCRRPARSHRLGVPGSRERRVSLLVAMLPDHALAGAPGRRDPLRRRRSAAPRSRSRATSTGSCGPCPSTCASASPASRSCSAAASGSPAASARVAAAAGPDRRAWEHSPIGPIRQYVRLLSSLVIFAERGARAVASRPPSRRRSDRRHDDARDRGPDHRLRRRRRGHRGRARPRPGAP